MIVGGFALRRADTFAAGRIRDLIHNHRKTVSSMRCPRHVGMIYLLPSQRGSTPGEVS